MAAIDALPAHLRQGLPSNVVDVVQAPGGGYYAVGADGGVFTLGGAQFHGSIPGLQGDTLAGQHQVGQGGFKLLPNGGYEVTDTAGRKYAFGPQAPPAPKANPLYSDPDFLAFTRAADYTLDAAAADVARRQAAVNRALATDLTTLQDSREKDLKSIDESAETRGVYRGGDRLRDRTQAESQYAQREGQVREQRSTELADTAQSLADKVAGLQQQAAEKGYGLAGEQALGQGYEAVQKKYPGLFPLTSKNPIKPA